MEPILEKLPDEVYKNRRNWQNRSIIQAMNLNKLENYWNDFEGTKITLEQMIEGYLWAMELHLKEIEVVLNEK
jgi:hypothetical protein